TLSAARSLYSCFLYSISKACPDSWPLCSPTIIQRGDHFAGDVAPKFPARLQRGRTNRNFVARLLLGWAVPLKAIPTQLPTKPKTIAFRFIGMRAPRRSRTHAFPISNKYHNKCCIFVTLLICTNV